jgi:hypothetical protein
LAIAAKGVVVAVRVAPDNSGVNGFCLNFLGIEPNWYRDSLLFLQNAGGLATAPDALSSGLASNGSSALAT